MPSYTLNRYASVPEKIPSMRRDLVAGLAQVAQRLDDRQPGADRRFVQIVRAARAPRLAAALRRSASAPLLAFLFGVTTWMPAASQRGYCSATRCAGACNR